MGTEIDGSAVNTLATLGSVSPTSSRKPLAGCDPGDLIRELVHKEEHDRAGTTVGKRRQDEAELVIRPRFDQLTIRLPPRDRSMHEHDRTAAHVTLDIPGTAMVLGHGERGVHCERFPAAAAPVDGDPVPVDSVVVPARDLYLQTERQMGKRAAPDIEEDAVQAQHIELDECLDQRYRAQPLLPFVRLDRSDGSEVVVGSTMRSFVDSHKGDDMCPLHLAPNDQQAGDCVRNRPEVRERPHAVWIRNDDEPRQLSCA